MLPILLNRLQEFVRYGVWNHNYYFPVGYVQIFSEHGRVVYKVNTDYGWLPADGREVPRDIYPALLSAIGTQFGTTSPTTFKLPDFRTMERTVL